MSWQPTGWQPDNWQPENWQPAAPGDAVSTESRTDFFVKPLRRDFYIRGSDVSDDYLFEEVTKSPSGSRKVRLRLYAIAVNEWKPNEPVLANEYLRPRIPNGFSYMVTVGGTLGAREPRYPKTIDATCESGSATLACKAASTNGINVVTDPVAVSDPSGLTISDVSVSEGCNILATYSGGDEDTDYDVLFTWTLDGVPMAGTQTVRVLKQ
jgi:hypothetical protein